ncbi:arylsulfatase [Parapedobacter sp. DT-150]|uniref:arylsulfatase n=1 Tax=Parapedobacter sp. DT-150 TaxID=3396162 RepID=UPI003F1CD4D8
MNRKKNRITWMLAGMASIILHTAAAQPATPPNIVFILADDLGYGSLGAYGQQLIQTPNLDKLAKRGMVWTDFYVGPVCAPTRGALISGMHLGHAYVRNNLELGGFSDDEEFGQLPLPPNGYTLGKVLQTAGYTTALFGKWGLGGPGSAGVPTQQGFDLFYGYLDQKQAHNYYPTHLWRNNVREALPNRPFASHQPFPEGGDPNDPHAYDAYRGEVYSGDTLTGEGIRFIENHRSKPFFLYMAYTIPHMALQVPERALDPYLGKFEDKPYLGPGYLPNRTPRATYAAMISLLDTYVGQLMETLDRCGLTENTLVIFTSDNGAATGGGADPDYFNCSAHLRGRKASLYEGGIRVPFIAAMPGTIPAGTRTAQVGAIWDMLPTFAELAGQSVTGEVDGVSLWPTLRDKADEQVQHPYLYWESHGRNGKQAVRFGRWKVLRKGTKQADGSHVYEVYDLENDESEQVNVAERHPEIISRAAAYMESRTRGVLPEWNYDSPVKR